MTYHCHFDVTAAKTSGKDMGKSYLRCLSLSAILEKNSLCHMAELGNNIALIITSDLIGQLTWAINAGLAAMLESRLRQFSQIWKNMT